MNTSLIDHGNIDVDISLNWNKKTNTKFVKT